MNTMWRLRAGLCLLGASLLAGGGAAAAAPAAPEIIAGAGKWVVNYGKDRCSLIRMTEGPGPLHMVLRTSLGSVRPELILVNPGWKADPLGGAEVAEVLLLPSGGAGTVPAVSAELATGARMLALRGFGPGFLDEYAKAERIVIQIKAGRIADLPIPMAAAAVRALSTCNDGLLTLWGLDLAERRTLRQVPEPADKMSDWISPEDYPTRAARKNQTGPVVARFVVGTDGRVSECVTVVSSGVRSLDERTCTAMARRKFKPAIGPDGNPVAVRLVETISWQLEDSSSRGGLHVKQDGPPAPPNPGGP